MRDYGIDGIEEVIPMEGRRGGGDSRRWNKREEVHPDGARKCHST